MKKNTLFLIMFLVVLVSGPALHQANTPVANQSDLNPPYDFSALDKLLQERAKSFGGLALIVSQDGNIIYDKGFEGLDTDTVIPIASASKWLSGGCLMAVIDNTTLSLDTHVSQYLDNFDGKKGEMTLRQLFSHTSGLPPSSGFRGDAFDKTITLEESVNRISELELVADPGTELWYGGYSMQVAGRVAEIKWLDQTNTDIVSGQAWMHIFNETIAKPLNMIHTDYQGLGQTTNPRIAGGIRSTGKEYLTFLDMLLNHGRFHGRRILSEYAVNQMLQDQTRNATIMQSPWEKYEELKPGASETRYGVGCWLEEVNVETGETVEVSSHGAFGFGPWIDLQRNISGVFTVFYRNEKTLPTYFDMKELLHQIIKESNQPPLSPVIAGPMGGKIYRKYEYTFSATDPDGDALYYYIDWGDDVIEEWVGPYLNKENVTLTHRWTESTDYLVKAKVKDSSGAESNWTSISVQMPKHKLSSKPMLLVTLLEKHPLLREIIKEFLGF